jgi:hydrogenase nickel incorporation protein HypA/HybF
VHERALMRDLVGRIDELAASEEAKAVTRITVRLGALSHFTPEHFREHFEDAARGTRAEGAEVEATLSDDTSAADAAGVLLKTIELEVPS